MSTYRGVTEERDAEGNVLRVTVDGEPLDLRTDLIDFQAEGMLFHPLAVVSRAILRHEFDQKVASDVWLFLKWTVLDGLGPEWELTSEQVAETVKEWRES